MKVLVAVVTKHGTTREIADEIGAVLRAELGDEVDVLFAVNVTTLSGYDAVVLFAGRIDRHRLGFGERALVAALRVPNGDYRNWAEIRSWATQIGTALRGAREHVGKA